MAPKILCLIPARGGSKSIPRKNILPLNGKPLIVHSIETAKACRLIDRVIVSTDDQEIAEVARFAGAEVPFLRPPEISGDQSLDFEVFEHCLDWLKKNENFEPDILVHFRPTSPNRSLESVEEAIQLLLKNPDADSIRAVCEPTQNPFKMWSLEEGWLKPLIESEIKEAFNQPRQALPKVYWQIGYIDVIRRSTIVQKKSMTGDRIKPLILSDEVATDIDSYFDFDLAGMKMRERK